MSWEDKNIVVEYDLPHPPAKVWRILTEPALLAAWLMENDIAPAVGHKFKFRAKASANWDGIVHCEILIVNPEKKLSYTWKGMRQEGVEERYKLNTVVTWTLVPKPGGTLLLLHHEGFVEADRQGFDHMGQGWQSAMLPGMKRVLGTL